ncbi:MAG TPA: hypothetical protein VGR47_07945 [Terracidiphilus sp.]|nr:hypothetical protein [Terracidiphilus sp.]
MTDLPSEIDQLVARIDSLERRVSALEHHPTASTTPVDSQPAITQAAEATPADASESFSVFSILGRAMLGIAGAYLLRAAADSNLLPIPFAAAIGISYAIAWLILAVRTRAGAWFPSTVYAATSALILSPMLWELVFRFHILTASGSAAVIAAYITSAIALAWRKKLTPLIWVANLASVLIALSLFFATRSTLPFIAVLLFILALAAFAESLNRVPGLRTLNALAASAAIWAAVYVYISPPATRSDYPVISPAVLIIPAFALFVIYLASVAHNTIARRRQITILEIILTVIAFLLAAVTLAAFGPPSSLVLFGVFCLTLAAAGYAAVYFFFDRAPQPRNYRVFSTWSAALVLAGCALSLPAALQTASFSLAAVTATALSARFSRFVLVFHGVVYLAAAAAASSLGAYVFQALTGALPNAPSASIYIAFLAAILCYSVMPRSAEPSWKHQTLQILTAALAICAAAALLVHLAIGLLALHVPPGPHHLAFFRTLSLCAAALALAWAGSRFSRTELTRLANATLVLLAIKLVAEDLRHGRLAYIAASIFFYALTLIAVPRVSRQAQKSLAAANASSVPANPPAVPPAAL